MRKIFIIIIIAFLGTGVITPTMPDTPPRLVYAKLTIPEANAVINAVNLLNRAGPNAVLETAMGKILQALTFANKQPVRHRERF